MTKAKHLELGYAVKDPKTGKFLDDDWGLAGLDEAEQFFTEQDAENFRDMVAFRRKVEGLVVVEIRTTYEEV